MISCRTDRRSPGAEFRPLADNRNGTEEERSRKNAPIMQEREGGEGGKEKERISSHVVSVCVTVFSFCLQRRTKP